MVPFYIKNIPSRAFCVYAVINFHHLSEYQSPSSSSSSSKANNNNKTLLLKGVSGAEVSKHTRERHEPEEEKSRPQDLSKAVVVEKTNQQKLNNRKVFGGVEEAIPSTSRAVIDKEANNKKSSDVEITKREKEETRTINMLSNPIENHYSREPDLRYTSLSDVSRSISSYAIDSVTANRLAMQEYDVQSVHSTNHHHRPYDSSALVNSQTAFERYDPNYTLQRTSMYSPYCQPTLEELASQQKYLLEQQQPPLMKTEPDDSNNGPIYPRPIYHAYDPTGKELRLLSFILIKFIIPSRNSSLQNISKLSITDFNHYNNRHRKLKCCKY